MAAGADAAQGHSTLHRADSSFFGSVSRGRRRAALQHGFAIRGDVAILQAALVPVSIGLMCASGLILSLTSARTWIAVLLTVAAAALALMTRLNPLWMLILGGILGFAGVI